jgi:hypothetical protein
VLIPESGADYSRVTHPFATNPPSKLGFIVRLACVKHAASVRPEPGSNSPQKSVHTTHKKQAARVQSGQRTIIKLTIINSTKTTPTPTTTPQKAGPQSAPAKFGI